MGGLFSALGSFWAWIGYIFDPLCGPAGLFTWFGPSTILACGDTGWGDEIAAGLKVTVAVALVDPARRTVSSAFSWRSASNLKRNRFVWPPTSTPRSSAACPELLTLFIIYYGMQILIQSVLASMGYDGRIEINAFVAGMIALVGRILRLLLGSVAVGLPRHSARASTRQATRWAFIAAGPCS